MRNDGNKVQKREISCVPINGNVPVNGTQRTGNGYSNYTENYTIFCGKQWPSSSDSNFFENNDSPDLFQCIDQCASWNSAYLNTAPVFESGECIGVMWVETQGLCWIMKVMEGSGGPNVGVDSAILQRDLKGV